MSYSRRSSWTTAITTKSSATLPERHRASAAASAASLPQA
nr:MAG TPA: hypothetical protein [Caudoviricetes sp.]